jgi:hypothetical protein
MDAARALIWASARSLSGRIQNCPSRTASTTRSATSSTGVYSTVTPASAMRCSNDSMVVGGVVRGVGLASSAGRFRHELNSPVRSIFGPGNRTDAPIRASTACSCA